MKKQDSFSEHYRLSNPFFRGWRSVYDFVGERNSFDFLRRDDKESLRSDWENVGNDICNAISAFKF